MSIQDHSRSRRGGASGGRCPRTGLALPECSCRPCLEEQLAADAPRFLRTEPRQVGALLPDAPGQPALLSARQAGGHG
jgi:hypothetical protein